MTFYQNAIIYKLKHNEDYDDLNIYIGSTCNFKHRKNCHKTTCNNENTRFYNIKVYQFIRDNGGWDEWVMIPIEQYSCNNKKELQIKERYHIDLLRPTLNKQIPTRTKKQYAENNKEKLAEYSKEWRENNKEKINEQRKEYREANKEKIAERNKKYRENNKEKIKERYENNKEKINKKIKEYREANKKKILERSKKYCKKYYENNKEKVICDHCGCEIYNKNLKRHQRTNKCINFVKKD
jgi:hypothetical protein